MSRALHRWVSRHGTVAHLVPDLRANALCGARPGEPGWSVADDRRRGCPKCIQQTLPGDVVQSALGGALATRPGPARLRRLVLLALLALCACGQPDRLVIDDDPELVDATMTALTDLEHEAGCQLFRHVVVGGRDRDWKGQLPTFGTVTVEVAPHKIPDGFNGWCAHPSWRWRPRARVYLEVPDEPRERIAHELLHALGLGHQDVKGLLMSKSPQWGFSDELIEQIRTKCVDGPAGPALGGDL